MPVIFRHKGCRFFFFSDEGDPREPIHVHIRCGDKLAKFWIEPDIVLAESYGFSSHELNRLAKIVTLNRQEIERAWHDHFDD